MYKYILLAKTQASNAFTYRFELVWYWLFDVVRYFILISLWGLTTNGNQQELNRLLVYFALMLIIRNLLASRTATNIAQAVKLGELNSLLIKPVDFIPWLSLMSISRILIKITIPAIIFTLMVFILPGIFAPASIGHLLIFFLFLIIATLLWHSLMAIVGMISFWTSEILGLVTTIDLSLMFLMGSFMPSYLFPQQMKDILSLTPISYFVAFPIDIYTGRVGIPQIIIGLFVMLVWLVVLQIVVKWEQKQGLYMYDANGA